MGATGWQSTKLIRYGVEGGQLRMRTHYVSRFYLEAFQALNHPGTIHQYDRQERSFARPAIVNVAVSRNYYPPDVERDLSAKIETPAAPALLALRTGDSVSDSQRFALAVFMATMLKRVPAHRAKATSLVPATLDEIADDFERAIKKEAGQSPAEATTAALGRLAETKQQLLENLPHNVQRKIFEPWASPEIIELIYSMKWKLVSTNGPSFFITSDNPVFHHRAYGLGTQRSELTFPIAPNKALFGFFGRAPRFASCAAKQSLVRESNRRLASQADRFLYADQQYDWISRLTSMTSRIRWQTP